jgi:hypothetical protein
MKSKSVCEAAGKPTSISLYPIWTSSMNMRRLRSGDIGSIRAWLPSRRSTAHQRGAAATCRVGHWRSGRSTANCFWYGAYRSKGIALGRCVAKGPLTVDMWLLQEESEARRRRASTPRRGAGLEWGLVAAAKEEECVPHVGITLRDQLGRA